MNISLTQSRMALDSMQSPAKSTRGGVCTLILLAALAAFETLNYSTTVYALQNMLGDYTNLGVHWSTLLAIAFCCVDIAGITQLFIPIRVAVKSIKIRYLFGTWLLAACMDTLLTWCGIATAITVKQAHTGWIVDSDILIKTIPAFIAFMIWLIRVLIVGAFSNSNNPALIQEQIRSSVVLSRSDPQNGKYGLFEADFPHTKIQYNRPYLISRPVSVRREPTYRGLPIRYKTF